ncbi:MAG: YjfB family protein [Dehalococcoidia bacterium]|nr:YjfB family protein [Dehalococcoidia bacterium]
MDQVSSIAALSTALATQRLASDASTLAAKKAMDAQRSVGAQLVALLDPNVGSRLNVTA